MQFVSDNAAPVNRRVWEALRVQGFAFHDRTFHNRGIGAARLAAGAIAELEAAS